MTEKSVLAFIGGSGLYDLPLFSEFSWLSVSSPWGEMSDAVRVGEIDGLKVCFLPRHGRGHVFSPSDINYRANIDGLKRLGVTDIISLSACGSFQEHLPPGTFVLPAQFMDMTTQRVSSFFSKGCVAHVSFAEPISPLLQQCVAEAAKRVGVPFSQGGVYLNIEGPQFASVAESKFYKSLGADVIGMTNATEAKLAREAEICYASVSMVTDFDSWRVGNGHEGHGTVDISSIMAVLQENKEKAAHLVSDIVRHFPRTRTPCPIGSDRALQFALMTAREKRDPNLVAKLDAVAGRIFSEEK